MAVRPVRGLALGAVAAIVVACAAPVASEPAPPVSPSEEETAMPPIRDVPAEIVEAALAAVEEREQVLRDSFAIRAAEAVTWRDGSLGCPQPGGMYTQALVPGYRIVLQYGDGREFHVHASRAGDVLVCDDPQPPVDATDER